MISLTFQMSFALSVNCQHVNCVKHRTVGTHEAGVPADKTRHTCAGQTSSSAAKQCDKSVNNLSGG